jgi:hypothetical protein
MSGRRHVNGTSSICGYKKPAPAKRLRRRSWSASARIPGAPESRAAACARAPGRARRQPGPWVLLRPAEDCAGEASAAPQHAVRLCERRLRVRHQHVSPPAEDPVDRVVGQVEPLGVEHVAFDVLEPERDDVAFRCLDHRLREVADDDAAALTMTRPPGPTSPAAPKPTTPVPAARSRIAWPGDGASSSSMRSVTGCAVPSK